MNPKHLPDPPMTLGNMREIGVHLSYRLLPQCCLPIVLAIPSI
jgi:hypothetical protein